MTFHDYLLKHLDHTAMISLSIDNQTFYQYNYWNWFHTKSEFHLLKDDFSIGHILHTGSILENEDGSITLQSHYHPKKANLNFYFGGVK
jgi:hypothetical protein